MLDKIYTYQKSIGIDTDKSTEEFKADFFTSFKQELEDSYIFDTEIFKSELRFKAPIARFTWNGWNVFNPVSEGIVKITSRKGIPWIHYKFKYLEFLGISALMSLSSIVAFSVDLVGWGILILLASWLVFFGISRAISTFRLNSYIARKVQKIIDAEFKDYDFDSYLKDEWKFIDFVFLSNRKRPDGSIG